MLQISKTYLLNLSSKISHNRTIMTSPATGTIPGGGIILTLDGRILHNSINNNLIFKMLLAQADHTFLHQYSSNNSPGNNKQLRIHRNLPLKNW